jgi:cytochrome P450
MMMGTSMTSTVSAIYYDPYDIEIDLDPYPVWQRMREEAPLYYNDEHDFYALSRYADVELGLSDWETYSSARGTLLEILKSGMQMPPGTIIFEDPPSHDIHRNLLRRAFTPRRIAALEPRIRELCAQALDPFVGEAGFDFIHDLGALMPMQVIAELLGIPEEDGPKVREAVDLGLKLGSDGKPNIDAHQMATAQIELFSEYIEWRVAHPSDDLMTELLNAEFTDEHGKTAKLTRPEVLGYVNLLAAAGNETTTRLIGWTGKVLADHPDQRALIAADRSLVGPAIEELLRYEPPSPVQARYVTRDVEHHGSTVPAGSSILLLNASANRDPRRFTDPDTFDVRRNSDRALSFGYAIHFCLGAALARLEGTIALDEVIQRFPTWEVDNDRAVRAHTSTVRGWELLPVRTA